MMDFSITDAGTIKCPYRKKKKEEIESSVKDLKYLIIS